MAQLPLKRLRSGIILWPSKSLLKTRFVSVPAVCMCRTLASVLAFLYRTSPIPKALVQETEAHRRRHLLAEGNCVVKEKKLNKVESQLARTKVKFAKLLSEADAVSIKLLAEKSAENKVGRCSCLLKMCAL